jgi:hypothetical protein
VDGDRFDTVVPIARLLEIRNFCRAALANGSEIEAKHRIARALNADYKGAGQQPSSWGVAKR